MDGMKAKFRAASVWLVCYRNFESGAVPNTGLMCCDVLGLFCRSVLWPECSSFGYMSYS